jgi:hypothetical protein
MTLSAGKGYNAFQREIWGFANEISFGSEASGFAHVAFEFTSPQSNYLVQMVPGIDSSAMAAGDVLSFGVTGNNLPIFITKFALTVDKEPIQSQLPELKFILPKLTILKAQFIMAASAMIGTASCSFRGVSIG